MLINTAACLTDTESTSAGWQRACVMLAERTGLGGTELGFRPGSASDSSAVSCWTSLSLSFLTGKMVELPYQPHTDLVRIKHRLQQKSWSKQELY